MTSALVLTAVLFAMILLNFLFVAVEFAFLTVDRGTVREQAAAGDAAAQRVDRALRRTSTHLSGAQLGITLSSLIAGFLTGPSVGVLLTEALNLTDLSPTVTAGIGGTVAFVLVTFLQMVIGELIPKNWALAAAPRVAKLVVVPQNIFMTVLGWLVAILNGSANWILRRLGFDPSEEVASARTAEELAAVAAHSRAEGTLDEGTADLVTRSIEFGEQTAGDVLRPRTQVEFLPADADANEILDAARRSGYSRFPVTGESVDDIVGVVHYQRALAVPVAERARRSARELADDALVVADAMTLDPLLRLLRGPGYQFAVVVDEFGGTAGIVTLEDLVEELVGDIRDEQDHEDEDDRQRRATDGTLEVSGLLRPDEVGEIFGLDLPEGENTETIGGLVIEQLDRLAEVGDVVEVEARDVANPDEDGLAMHATVRLTVRALDGHRVQWLGVEVVR